jgi:endonuclease/exonuclease/phosphatase family metal-dependent hydrolase
MNLYILTVLLLLSTLVQADDVMNCEDTFKVTSWNIRDLGDSKDEAEMAVIASLIADSDIVAIQEVVAGAGGPKAVNRLLELLQIQDAEWKAKISKKTTGTGTERYAFLWKSDEAYLVDNVQNGLNNELADTLDREPFIQGFAVGKSAFAIVNFHAVPTAKKPSTEIVQLTKLDLIEEDYPTIVVGDFNLGFSKEAFDGLRENGLRSHIRGKTALKLRRKNEEHLTHPYDNIFTEQLNVCDSGIEDFSINYEKLKQARYISDHLPIWVTIAR